jgi:hypothetical protein
LRQEFQRLVHNLWDMSQRWTGKAYNAKVSRAPSNQAGMYARHLECLVDGCQQSAQFSFDLYDHSCKPPSMQQYFSPRAIATPQQHSRMFVQKSSDLDHVRHNSLNSVQSTLSPRRVPHTTIAYGATAGSPVEHAQQHSLSQTATGMSPRPTSSSYVAPHVASAHNTYGHPPYDLSANYAHNSGTALRQVQPVIGAHNQSVQDQSLLTLSDTFMDSQFLDMDRVITFEDANFFMPYGEM